MPTTSRANATNLSMIRRSAKTIWILAAVLSGCRGAVPGINATGLQSPTRVPAPATGSFQVPASYTPNTNPNAIGTGLRSSSLPSTQPLSQASPVLKSGLRSDPLPASQEDRWHATDLGTVTAAALGESPSGVAQASFARITSRLDGTNPPPNREFESLSAADSTVKSEPGTAPPPAPKSDPSPGWRKVGG